MGDRRLARELALQALFFIDVEKGDPSGLLQVFCSNFEDRITEVSRPFFLELVNGVIRHRAEIDREINQSSQNWRLSRMPVVDRNVMRIALYEMLFCDDIPATVSINEAVDIGKKFGTRQSGPFINGVLDRVRLERFPD